MDHNPYFTTEIETSQKPAIELLKELGYKYIKPEDAEKMRDRPDRVLLKDILKAQLVKLNSFEYKGKWYKFSDKNINQAMLDLDEPLIDGLIKTNEKIYDHLVLGKSFEETLDDTSKKSFSLRYVDWENILNNEFHVTEEYSIEKLDGTTRRPDIVLFVNGIPLAVIECKKTAISLKEGISQ
ncbi:MAG: DEAD/DEAH box helicase, partial [Bacteroidales bacterium]|nr:DEAD/DEAH box helicase [Bacteroidales bacterium]